MEIIKITQPEEGKITLASTGHWQRFAIIAAVTAIQIYITERLNPLPLDIFCNSSIPFLIIVKSVKLNHTLNLAVGKSHILPGLAQC